MSESPIKELRNEMVKFCTIIRRIILNIDLRTDYKELIIMLKTFSNEMRRIGSYVKDKGSDLLIEDYANNTCYMKSQCIEEVEDISEYFFEEYKLV